MKAWNLENKHLQYTYCQIINHTQTVVEKRFLDPFLKTQNWAYLWINCPNVYTVCFHSILTCRSLAFISFIPFSENKKRSGPFLDDSFPASFLNKNIFLIVSQKLTKFHRLVAFTSWDIAQYVHRNCSLTKLSRHQF